MSNTHILAAARLPTAQAAPPTPTLNWEEPVKLTRPHVMAALQELGFEGVKVTLGKKAGCSCGCSPCFVADRMLTWEGRGLQFISVRREGEK